MYTFANPLKLDEIIYVNYPFLKDWLKQRNFFDTSLNKKILNKIIDKYLLNLDDIKDRRLKAYQLYNKKLIERKEEVKEVLDNFLIFLDGLATSQAEGIPFKAGYDWLSDRISLVKKIYEFAKKDDVFKRLIYWPKTPIIEMPIVIENKPRFVFDFVMKDVNKNLEERVFNTEYINYTPNYKFYSSLIYLDKARNYVERKKIKGFGDFGLGDDEFLRYCVALASRFLPLARDLYVFEEFDVWKVIEKNVREYRLKGIPVYAIKGSWIKYLEKLAREKGLRVYYVGEGILKNENYRSQDIFKREINVKALKVFYSFVKGVFKREKESFKRKRSESIAINFFECPSNPLLYCCIEDCKKYNKRCMVDLINDKGFFSKLEKKVYDDEISKNDTKMMGIENMLMLLNTNDFDVLSLDKSHKSWRELMKDSLLIPFPFYKFKANKVERKTENYMKASELGKLCKISRLFNKFDLKKLEEIAKQEGISIEKKIEPIIGNVRHKAIIQQKGYILDNFVLKDFLEKKNKEGLFVSLVKDPYYYARPYYCEKSLTYTYKDINVYGKADACLFVDGKNKAIAILDVKQKYRDYFLNQLMVYGLALKQKYNVAIDNIFLIIAQLRNTLPYFHIYNINLNDKKGKEFINNLHQEIIETIKNEQKLLHDVDFFIELKQAYQKNKYCEKCLDKDICNFLETKTQTSQSLINFINENNLFKQKI